MSDRKTITAVDHPKARCKKCHYRPRDRSRLYGVNAQGITVADAQQVASWICDPCFTAGGKAQR